MIPATLILVGAMLLVAEVSPADAAADDAIPTSLVGMSARIDQLVLPGTPLIAKPITDRQTPVVLRVVATYPHGTAYRYDIEYYVLEPGTHDLRAYLQRADGSAMDDVPPILVKASTSLPAGQVQPEALVPAPLPRVGGYRTLLLLAGICWVVGLLAILWTGRRRKRKQDAMSCHEATLDERLQAAVKAAEAGELGTHEYAELERMVLAHWRRRLSLEDAEAAAAIAAMRRHPQARAALEQLEQWLHRPEGHGVDDFKQLIVPTQGRAADVDAANPDAADDISTTELK